MLIEVALIHLVINAVVLFLVTKFFSISVPLKRAWRILIGLWLIGLTANMIGALVLTSIGGLGVKLHMQLIDYYMIYSSPWNALIFVATVAFSGLILYLMDYLYLRPYLTKKQALRMAFSFAVLTAPYPFLISAHLFY